MVPTGPAPASRPSPGLRRYKLWALLLSYGTGANTEIFTLTVCLEGSHANVNTILAGTIVNAQSVKALVDLDSYALSTTACKAVAFLITPKALAAKGRF